MLKKLVRKVKLAVGITFISILPNADGCVETLKEILEGLLGTGEG